MNEQEDPYGWRSYAKYSAMAIAMCSVILLTTWGGVTLDKNYPEYDPFAKIAGIVFGMAVVFAMIMKEIKTKK